MYHVIQEAVDLLSKLSLSCPTYRIYRSHRVQISTLTFYTIFRFHTPPLTHPSTYLLYPPPPSHRNQLPPHINSLTHPTHSPCHTHPFNHSLIQLGPSSPTIVSLIHQTSTYALTHTSTQYSPTPVLRHSLLLPQLLCLHKFSPFSLTHSNGVTKPLNQDPSS